MLGPARPPDPRTIAELRRRMQHAADRGTGRPGAEPEPEPPPGVRAGWAFFELYDAERAEWRWHRVPDAPTPDPIKARCGGDGCSGRVVLMRWYRYDDPDGVRRYLCIGQCSLCGTVYWHAPGVGRPGPRPPLRGRLR